jgi:YHS domain-containing protein
MRKILILAVLTAVVALRASGQVPPIYQDGGLAIKGYDVVAYFTVGQPTKGSTEFTYKWMGATWQFANAKDLELFKADPGKYAPQYGGYCAYAVSKNHTASVNPKNWKIVDGKLYLNHDIAYTFWKRNIPENIKKADGNWPAIEKESVH